MERRIFTRQVPRMIANRYVQMLRWSLKLTLFLFMFAPLPSQAAEPEFGGACVMGLAEGQMIKTTCSVNWTDTDGKLYCFAREDSKKEFLRDPLANLQRAKDHFAAGDMESTSDDMGKFTGDDVKTYVIGVITAEAENNGGLYPVNDAMLGRTLALKFEKIDFVRTLHGYGFFPNIIFADKDLPDKRYQIDFWIKPKDGKLSVVDIRVYKAPRKEGEKWVMITRQPKPWWWIPASEHPGKSEEKRGWEIMSTIHAYIAAERAKNGGIYSLKDEKTGETINMDFVGIHQPVRRLPNGGKYFACTDFRKDGSKEEFYDIDFWMDEKNGKIEVGSVRVHKVPVMEDGNFIQMPRYTFDELKPENVP